MKYQSNATAGIDIIEGMKRTFLKKVPIFLPTNLPSSNIARNIPKPTWNTTEKTA